MEAMMEGTPWLTQPVMLHSSRAYKCKFSSRADCAYQQGFWRFWYQADHRYGEPTVAFFCVAIGIFALAYFGSMLMPRRVARSTMVRKAVAMSRYLSYKNYRIGFLDWNSAPVGILLLGVAGAVYFLAMTFGPKPYYWPSAAFGDSQPIATRSGWLSLACLPFAFATAGKSNLITMVTGVSHEKLQVFHRWISYAFLVTALIHTFPFIVINIQRHKMVATWDTSVFYWTGVVALLAQAWLTFASVSPLRNLGYEFFKFTHFLAALVFTVFLFLHCNFRLSSWDYFIATGVLFSLSWLHSQLRVAFEHGIGCKAKLTLTSTGFVRVAVPTNTTWVAGQHYFVRFLSVNLQPLSSHPFTACSLPKQSTFDSPKGSELVFYIRPQGGFTKKLAKHVVSHPDSTVRIMLDGPYGGISMSKIAESDKNLVIAGGSGSGWALPLVECHMRRMELIAEANASTKEQQTPRPLPSLRVVLATRERTTRKWFEQMMAEMFVHSTLTEEQRNLAVQVFYTGTPSATSSKTATQTGLADDKSLGEDVEKDTKLAAETVIERKSSSSSSSQGSNNTIPDPHRFNEIEEFDGRPEVQSIIADEASKGNGSSLSVFLCGPMGMQKDASDATAAQQLAIMKGGSGEVYLHMEHFSWA